MVVASWVEVVRLYVREALMLMSLPHLGYSVVRVGAPQLPLGQLSEGMMQHVRKAVMPTSCPHTRGSVMRVGALQPTLEQLTGKKTLMSRPPCVCVCGGGGALWFGDPCHCSDAWCVEVSLPWTRAAAWVTEWRNLGSCICPVDRTAWGSNPSIGVLRRNLQLSQQYIKEHAYKMR